MAQQQSYAWTLNYCFSPKRKLLALVEIYAVVPKQTTLRSRLMYTDSLDISFFPNKHFAISVGEKVAL
jgi:hypothetical protein